MLKTTIISGLVGCAASYGIGYHYGKWVHLPPHLTGSALAICHLAYRLLQGLYEWKHMALVRHPLSSRLKKICGVTDVDIYRFYKSLLINLTTTIQMFALVKLNLLRKHDMPRFCIVSGMQTLLLLNHHTLRL